MRLGDPPTEARTPACSSAGNRGSVLATRPAGACRDRRTRRPKQRPRRRRRRRRRRRVSPWGYSAQCWGGGVTTAASAASAASTAASTLLPGHASACNVDGDQASRSTCRIRRKGDVLGVPAGTATPRLARCWGHWALPTHYALRTAPHCALLGREIFG
jgi:hypothetical protein